MPVPRPGHAVPDADAVRLAHHEEQHPVRPAGAAGRPAARARRPELDQEATTLLDRVGLAGFGDAFPHELSGGMQHRAAFARALAARPSLLLMDEPFGALDAITRERMHEFLLDIWEQHRITIIFVTHDIEEAILLGDRVAVMGGRPPGIGEIIDIPLTRPRHALDTDTEAFLTAKRRIRAALRS
jgi:NitT/TauT family transport system ATP-binding protein